MYPDLSSNVPGHSYTAHTLKPGWTSPTGSMTVDDIHSEQCCDMWFVDEYGNAYGYLEGATNLIPNNKVLHVHFPVVRDGGYINFLIQVNTNINSANWGDVTITRYEN